MKTLDHWKARLTETPSYIECPEMRLMTGRDFEPAVFVGPAELNSRTARLLNFGCTRHPGRTVPFAQKTNIGADKDEAGLRPPSPQPSMAR
jgi:hypothetical protein